MTIETPSSHTESLICEIYSVSRSNSELTDRLDSIDRKEYESELRERAQIYTYTSLEF